MDWRNLTARALHTFWQGFVAVVVLPDQVVNVAMWKAAVLAGAMAALSAIKSALVEYLHTDSE